ncbi:MAG TPA: universal stress protein [Gammaproteobacteria bacterium]|jgi:universal stress protein A|nr:universal stress protein [Gammaproteobacteria bacterium]
MTYRQILLAVDIAPGSDAIGHRAAALADAFGARINLLHVVEYVPMDPAGEALMPPPVDLETEMLEGARSRLQEFAARVGLENAPRDVCVGGIKSEIVRAAQAIDADLIVIGRHQRHGLALFRGSTERSLVTAAPCDVLAVRVEEQE